MQWLPLTSVTLTSFLASLVEFVEALTIVLAVGTTRNWRSAILGSIAAVLALSALIVVAGPALQQIPVRGMQLLIGAVVLVFGLKWLRKATLRAAGRIKMHDEGAEYAAQVAQLGDAPKSIGGFDTVAFLTSLKAVFLEGLEVAFIVITAGSVSGHFWPAIVGAALALVLVLGLGVLLHRPLARVPENTLKRTVGIMLCAFGVFWFGEGLGFEWPYADASILLLIAVFATGSFAVARGLRIEVARDN